MDFLEEILGKELFAQLKEKLNAHNGEEANKDKQIQLGNIASGEYVGKEKLDSLQEMLNGTETELTTANKLIEDLKKGTKDDSAMQEKISAYETEISTLQEELLETRIKSEIKVSLLAEKAVDVDYLTYKLNEMVKGKGEQLELDENGKIKGWDDKVTGLKTQFPAMFESSAGGRKVLENKLNTGAGNTDSAEPKDLAEAIKMEYEENN